MNKRIDIHDFTSRLNSGKRRVQLANPISERNSKIIMQFENYGVSDGLSKARITKYVLTLRKVAKMLSKNFDEATREDIEQLVNHLERSEYSAWTKHDYKVTIKRFYKWLKGDDEEYPIEVKWIKTTFKKKDSLLPDDLLAEEEVQKLVDTAGNPRDKAFIITS